MLTVIKRSGREEEFDVSKIMNSAAAASDELRQPLSKSDIRNLASDVEKRLEGKEKITSQEIFVILIDTMRKQGFTPLADLYENHSK